MTRFSLKKAAANIFASSVVLLTLMAPAAYPAQTAVSISVESATGTNAGTTIPVASSFTTSATTSVVQGVTSFTDSNRVEIASVPTLTSPGLAYNFIDTTSQRIDTTSTYSNDFWSASVAATGDLNPGFKWLQISGTISANLDTWVRFSLGVSGIYENITSPFGLTTPALPTFYFGSSMSALQQNATATTSVDFLSKTYNSTSSAPVVNLLKGAPTSFAAMVLATDHVGLTNFALSAVSANYNGLVSTQTFVSTSTRLIGATVLTPVDEPQLIWLLTAGLGMLGIFRRRSAAAG